SSRFVRTVALCATCNVKRRSRRIDRHGEPETAALSWRAFNTDLAVHCFNQRFRDRQPQAATAICARAGSITAIKTLKDVGQILWGNPFPGIRDAYRHPLRRGFRRDM